MANRTRKEKLSRETGFFKLDLKTDKLKKDFKEVYSRNDGKWSAIKTELAGKAEFTPEVIKKLDFTHHLAKWGRDNEKLVVKFQKDEQVNSLRDIAAKYPKKAFIDKVKDIASAEVEEEKTAFAVNLHRELFNLEATAMVVNIIKDPQVPLFNDAIGAHVAMVLEKEPDFNIKTTSIYEVIKNKELFTELPPESHDEIGKRLKILQCITAVCLDTDALPVMYNANLHSAAAISEIPRAQFLSAMETSGLEAEVLMQIHNNARLARVRNEHFLMSIREAGRPTGVAMIDKSLGSGTAMQIKKMENDIGASASLYQSYVEDSVNKNNLSWDLLFGDADLCACGECNSVYGPASYFVELLQYLRNNNSLVPDGSGKIALKSNPADITGTPLEKLFNRRPDLGCLELTCKNTKTILPYIDLVNEVMEQYVAYKHLKPFNIEDEVSSELLAEPQHTEYQAYCILKNEVYPFTLPYHQPIDAARIYLDYLNTSRYELIKTFRKNNAGDDEELTLLQDEALDRAVDAEYLGLTKEEYIILTKECFINKALMDRLKDKVHTDAEYLETIGVKPVCQYYGYEDDSTMLGTEGLTLIKKEFLRRTGIDYFNLVDLLKTETINPFLPRGKAKVITESLHFSYRFLQNYARVFGMDAMARALVTGEKLAELVPRLKEMIDLLTNRGALRCPSTSRDKVEISEKEIIHWVKCHFENLGKMIVIENGTECVNGTIISYVTGNNTIAISIKKCKIIVSGYSDKPVEIGEVDKHTGKLTFTNTDVPVDIEVLKNLPFTGDRGEKGIFLIIGGEVYLVFFEQKDTCNLDTALLQHLDGTPLTADEYDRIHRFIRLWRKLGWTIPETDQAITGLTPPPSQDTPAGSGFCDGDGSDECSTSDTCDCEDVRPPRIYQITPSLIHQLSSVKKLLGKTGIELVKLLTLWSTISTYGEKSLYRRLFLTHNILGIDDIFKADSSGNYLTQDVKLTDHVMVIMAAFGLLAADFQAITASAGLEDKLTLPNLSLIYRYRLLSRVLDLKIPSFIKILPLFGNIFENASQTLLFMERWAKMEDAGFTHQQLNFIIRDVDDAVKPLAPTKIDILKLSKTLYDGLNAIDLAHKDLQPDEAITDPALQEINIRELSTTELVRTKSSLLFDTTQVEKIIGLLEGTLQFITNAPKELEITIADTSSLKEKLLYNKTQGTIQTTGVLTDSEIFEYKALEGSAEWTMALTRIQKQQDKLYKELLSGIFENEKTKTDAEKAQLEAILKAGDIKIRLDQITPGEDDPNTAPSKRAAFLKIFLPYLRLQLTHRFVIETLAAYTELDTKVTDILVSRVLKSGTAGNPLYSIFEKIKESNEPDLANWTGYVIPAADTGYTFIIKNSDTKPVVTLDNTIVDFTAQEDPTNEWWSTTLSLQSGTLYKLETTGVELKNIYWKTPSSAITAIPSSALIPDFTSSQCGPALTALKKAAILTAGFKLTRDELLYFDEHPADFDNLDFNGLTLGHWLRLEAYVRLRNSLPKGTFTLLDFWNWTGNSESDASLICEKIAELTTWKKDPISTLIAEDHFNIMTLADYRNEKNLLKLQKALKVAGKIGVDINLLFDWALPSSKFNTCRTIADSIKHAIRAKYSRTDWELAVRPLHDRLRNNQKKALIGYLLQQKELIEWNVTDANGLFEYFLIDVQMEPAMETSRMKQAISSVQLFIQRCFLGLEAGVAPSVLDRKRWEWMQRYRVWEANRKVFLYPENWIESNLRDDKSSFFKELESELLQKDINKQNIIDGLKNYLYKVDETANMEVVGLYIEMQRDNKGVLQDTPSKLHVFSRTRNAPFLFYYRYFDMTEKNWYPWEKMQVDIPSYDVEDLDTHEVTGNGCFLTPVVWNGRLLIFFPQIVKKTRTAAPGDKIKTSKASDGNVEVPVSKPIDYYEVKMAWSEYRNGKWTQKQVSKGAVCTDHIDDTHNLPYFKFIPIVYPYSVKINFDDYLDNDGGFKGAFDFDGSRIDTASKVSTSPIPIDYFNQDDNKMYSWQLKHATLERENTNIYFYEHKFLERAEGIETASIPFNHPYSKDLLGIINLGRLDHFFLQGHGMFPQDYGLFDHDDNPSTPDIFHELKSPYSLYNWELFFHTPLLLADALSKAQHFEEAMKWFHFVFNPIADGGDDKRFWMFAPFRKIDSKRILDSIFNNLKPNKADKAINEWRNKPFMPHVIARSRPVAYMKWVVMKYLDNLIAWGDYLFRQDTIETINRATQLYVLAGHILGPKPMMIPQRGKIRPRTYLGLLDKWDAFGNAMVELELTAPFSNQTPLPLGGINEEPVLANIYGLASSLYFCIPNNPKLMGYWDTLADRLYKIRHCQNISGVFRKLPLFEPPIDPALLVRAAAQGLSIASVLNDLNTPMPNYRFYYLLQKAIELCNELKSLGNAMLSAIEKKDNEKIALIRAKHEGVMQNLVMEIKKKQLDEAQKSVATLEQNRKTVEARMKYYLKLSGLDESSVPDNTADFTGLPNEIVTVDGGSGLKLIPFEKEDMDKAKEAQDKQLQAALPEKIASILHIIPNFSGNIQPFGIGCSISFGGSNLGAAAQAWAKFLQLDANELSYASTSAGKKGGFTRALQDRIFQANAAGFELKQIDKQITAQKIRVNIAQQEITNQQKTIDNAREVEEFIKNKYSNQQLYEWMRGSLKTLYHQVYNLSYDLAKKAEKTYCFERGIKSSSFIQAGYFDAGRDGLLAGEKLYVGLKQLEAAFQSEQGHDFEITKHISLYQLNPLAVVELRETGKCEFVLPEVLFDLDYPGHYKRRIKSVSLSVPCICGPYTGLNATLSLLENKFRNTSIGGKAYEENTEETDERFSSHNIPISAIAAGSARNDSGLFELNFTGERYLPFEGAGVISKWRLELPEFKQYDYNTISDVILHVRYTACEGGQRLKLAAAGSVSKQLKNLEQQLNETGLHTALNMRHDLPNQWQLLKKNGTVDLQIDKTRLPYMVQTLDTTVDKVIFLAKSSSAGDFSITIDGRTVNFTKINDNWKYYRGSDDDIDLGESFTLAASTGLLEDLIMIVKYSF